ncbi:MAG: hypothetical protein ABJC24_02840 [Chloroflexota bacterium]
MPRVKAPEGTDAAGDPNKLVRKKAGTYQTTDERFEVRQAALGWFLIDSMATDELGQELVRGPFQTLNAVREALPDARRTTLKPLPRPKGVASPSKAKPKPAPAPMIWIDRLPKAEATAARRLIHALELEGVSEAEKLVQDARKDREPTVARRVLEGRLETIVSDLPEGERDIARHVMQRVLELLTKTGTTLFVPLPGWALVEMGAEPGPPNRRIVLRSPSKRPR